MYVQFRDRLKKIGEQDVPGIHEFLGKNAERFDKAGSSPGDLYAIYGAYREHVLETSPVSQAKQIPKLLKALAAAYEPLTQSVIARIIGISPEGVAELVRKIGPFLRPSVADDTLLATEDADRLLAIDHDSMRRFLLENLRGRAAAHALLVKAYRPRGGDWSKLDWRKAGDSQDASRYARRYLVDHAYECYRATAARHKKARRRRADDFLNLVCEPGCRTVRLVELRLRAALQDVRRGLYVAFSEYAFPTEVIAPQAVGAFDCVLAAMGADDNWALVSLEQELRREKGGVPALLRFLQLSSQ
jgi:hypothetical protein